VTVKAPGAELQNFKSLVPGGRADWRKQKQIDSQESVSDRSQNLKWGMTLRVNTNLLISMIYREERHMAAQTS
jgi:hypothetical protein